MSSTILIGDVTERLAELPDESVQCVVTSPPYFALRDYGTGTWEGGDAECDHSKAPAEPRELASNDGGDKFRNGTGYHDHVSEPHRDTCGKCGARRIDSQIGLEPTPAAYLERMVAVFREVRRVLRHDATAFVNMGDGFQDKQLVGMPWRLALALQAPYEKVVLRNREDRAWLAALIDGEGCITTSVVQPTTGTNESYPIILQVRMSDRECLDRIVELTGMSHVQAEALSPSMVSGNQRPASCWKVAGENAATLLAEIYPYLLIKKRQALVAWNLQRLKDGITTKRGVAIPAANMELRRELHRVIRALNQREVADVPGWCKEPKYTIEPGWHLRSDVIWHKPNPMPESCTDRPTKSHEYVFLLTKSARYFYDAEAVREASLRAGDIPAGDNRRGVGEFGVVPHRPFNGPVPPYRNLRTVWTIATESFKGAHFATFPRKLVAPCLKAGTSAKGRCPECGAPWVRVVEKTALTRERPNDYVKRTGEPGTGNPCANSVAGVSVQTTGWRPQCEHGLDPVPCVCLDPFCGSGTVGVVAKQLGLDFIGVELNPEYAAMAERRIANPEPEPEIADVVGQMTMFS